MLKKCSTWMEGSLLVCMVVISRVGIISAVGELEVAISKSLRVRVYILERKMKCFRVKSNSMSL